MSTVFVVADFVGEAAEIVASLPAESSVVVTPAAQLAHAVNHAAAAGHDWIVVLAGAQLTAGWSQGRLGGVAAGAVNLGRANVNELSATAAALNGPVVARIGVAESVPTFGWRKVLAVRLFDEGWTIENVRPPAAQLLESDALTAHMAARYYDQLREDAAAARLVGGLQ